MDDLAALYLGQTSYQNQEAVDERCKQTTDHTGRVRGYHLQKLGG
jgi:hypothetical protein